MRGAGTMARIQALVLVKVDRPLALNLVEGFLEAGRYRLPDCCLQGFTAAAHGKGVPAIRQFGRRARPGVMF
jgi:hypothetical protein